MHASCSLSADLRKCSAAVNIQTAVYGESATESGGHVWRALTAAGAFSSLIAHPAVNERARLSSEAATATRA